MVDWEKLLLVLGVGAAVASLTFIVAGIAAGVFYVAHEAFVYLSQPLPPEGRILVGMWLIMFAAVSFIVGVRAYSGNGT